METKSSFQALEKECETVEDLIKVNGFIEDLNNGKEINMVVKGNQKEGMSCMVFSVEQFLEGLR